MFKRCKSLPVPVLLAMVLCASCKKNKETGLAIPKVTTIAVSNVVSGNASTGGTILDNGGSTITASGVCYSKVNQVPTITDNTTITTATSGSFTSVLQNLQPNSTYYVRAYARNSVGTGYGEVVQFMTGNAGGQPASVTFTYNGRTVTYGVITSPATGRQWLDRNLGAANSATAYNDWSNYGDLFQWGRKADGHQLVARSGPLDIQASLTGYIGNYNYEVLSPTDDPGHAFFIFSNRPGTSYDWRGIQNDNLWQQPGQINNPCPSGWRIPTQSEWEAEGLSNLTAAYSQLKLTLTGQRPVSFPTTLTSGSELGLYWASTVVPSTPTIQYSAFISMSPTGTTVSSSKRADGFACRCIKD